MSHHRTFRLDHLYHKFLEPQGLSADSLSDLATALEDWGLIEVYISDGGPRYRELPKLVEGSHRTKIFKLISKLKREARNETA